MSDNSIRFEATTGAVQAEPDSVVTMQNLPDENAGIMIEPGSRGFLKFGGKASAFSFDIDARQSVGRAFKLPKNTTRFSIAGGPLIYTIGTAEWVS